MTTDNHAGQDVQICLGITQNSFGKQCPTMCALVSAETVDEATHILEQAIPAAEKKAEVSHTMFDYTAA